jgi:hypothetical protein
MNNATIAYDVEQVAVSLFHRLDPATTTGSSSCLPPPTRAAGWLGTNILQPKIGS